MPEKSGLTDEEKEMISKALWHYASSFPTEEGDKEMRKHFLKAAIRYQELSIKIGGDKNVRD